MKDRSYKIKNLIKEQPTYAVLMKRNTNGIDSDICQRCKKFIEDWEHIWICESNELELDELLKQSLCEYGQRLMEINKHEELEIMKNVVFNFIEIMDKPYLILIGKKRIWAFLRGAYNDNFNKISNKKKVKDVIKDMWYSAAKNKKKMGIAPSVEDFKALEGYTQQDEEIKKQILMHAGMEITEQDKTIANFLGSNDVMLGTFI
ncbi:hypothetical protein C1646_761737 [Rhizophagus diaphanus]|nr:hypothetical protein C1646_761737 [Rhizophagus diaphanus] [Rhizophagus sp. MUCL 43196]